MIATQPPAQPLQNIATAPPKFPAKDIKRLESVAAKIAEIDGRLLSLKSIKETFENAAENFAEGKLDLAVAVGIVGSGGTSREARAAVESTLRRACKKSIVGSVQKVADLLDAGFAHRVGELARKCATLEKRERAEQIELGVPADSFIPSGLLASLRVNHLTEKGTLDNLRKIGFTRHEFRIVAQAVGVIIPKLPIAALVDDDDADDDGLDEAEAVALDEVAVAALALDADLKGMAELSAKLKK